MFKSITGTFDVLPISHTPKDGATIPGAAAWRYVEATVREGMHRFGFEEVRTPVMEALDLVARGVGGTTDIVQKEMFTVERGRDTYVLRPEVTAPVVRAALQHNLLQRGGAQRLFYIGPCFRAERPQKGRYRQFHQFGVELLGSDQPTADVEAIANLRSIYAAFGVGGTRLRLNTLGDPADRPAYRDALRAYFAPYADELSPTSRQRLETNPLRILDTKDPREAEIASGAPLLPDFVGVDARSHYEAVKSGLDTLGIPYVEDPRLVRGLDYYTRTVFELESDALGAQSALAAGGRYDGLAQAVGSKQRVPAVGYAAGIERLFIALAEAGVALPEAPRPDAFLVCMDDDARTWALAAAQDLRAAGLRVEFDLLDRAWRKQLKEAARQQARFAVIVGPDDLACGHAQVRDLGSGDQRSVPFRDLAASMA